MAGDRKNSKLSPTRRHALKLAAGTTTVITTGTVPATAQEQGGVQTLYLEQVDFDRTPHITTTETDDYDTIPDDVGAQLFGAPISSSLLIQVEADLANPVTIDEASVRLEDSSGQEIYSWQRDLVGEITTGTYTYRVQIENGALNELPPGEYTAFVTLSDPLRNTGQDSNYEFVDGVMSGSTEFIIDEKTEAPTVSVPKADYDDDGEREQAIGKPVNVSLDENPARRFFENTFSLIAVSLGASDTLPAFGVNRGAVNDLAINTAQARLRADDGTISIYWQNKRTRDAEGQGIFEIPYDRAVVTAKVPDSVTIADNGGADYAIHNTDAEQYELTWITTEIDKGIPIDFTTFGFDYNNPTGIESFEVESDSEEQITIEYGLSLQLGPLLQNPAERPEYGLRYYIPIEGQIADVQGRYDYETWQENPDEMYWASIGVDQRTSTVNLSGSASVEIVNPTLEPPAVEAGQSTQHTFSFDTRNVSADGNGDDFEVSFPDSVDVVSFSDVDIESPSSNIEKNDNTLNFSVDPSGGGTTQVSVSMTVTLSTTSNSTVVDNFETGNLEEEWTNKIGTWGGGTDNGRDAFTVQSQTAPEGNYSLRGDRQSASDGHSSILRDDFNISEDGLTLRLYAQLGSTLNFFQRANKIEFLSDIESEGNKVLMLDQKNRQRNENNARVGNGNTPNSVLDSPKLIEFKNINFSSNTVGEVIVDGTQVGTNMNFINDASQITAITIKQGHYSQPSDVIVDQIEIE